MRGLLLSKAFLSRLPPPSPLPPQTVENVAARYEGSVMAGAILTEKFLIAATLSSPPILPCAPLQTVVPPTTTMYFHWQLLWLCLPWSRRLHRGQIFPCIICHRLSLWLQIWFHARKWFRSCPPPSTYASASSYGCCCVSPASSSDFSAAIGDAKYYTFLPIFSIGRVTALLECNNEGGSQKQQSN